jgi:uncharacterized membrane protein YkvA (DUF1232 family)
LRLVDIDIWEKLIACAKSVGRATARPVLLLYFVLKSPDTPKSDKLLIVSTLSYLILPVNLLSAKRLSVIGWVDEIVLITYAYKKVCKHITPEIEWKVEKTC